MLDERAAGAIAYREGPLLLLMIKDAYEQWTFPKGLLEEGEGPVEAALRELAEETGVRGELVQELGASAYSYQSGDGSTVHKQAIFYLVRATRTELRVQLEEIAAAEWVEPAEAKARLGYANLQPVLAAAMQSLVNTCSV